MWTSTEPDVTEVLRSVRTAGTPMALLADVPWPVADAIEGTTWRATLITRTVFSSQTGVTKLAARAFDTACVAVRARPERILYVGTSRGNLDAATRFDVKALHYTGNPAELAAPMGGAGGPATALRPIPVRPPSPASLTPVTQLRPEEGLHRGAGTRQRARAHRRTGPRHRNRSDAAAGD
jgi:putative hydrolase of the HAD superfamily